jgi:hypothetical protein
MSPKNRLGDDDLDELEVLRVRALTPERKLEAAIKMATLFAEIHRAGRAAQGRNPVCEPDAEEE